MPKQIKTLLVLPLSGGSLAVGAQLAECLQRLESVELSLVVTGQLEAFYAKSFGHIEDERQRMQTVARHINLAALGEVISFGPDLVLTIAGAPIHPPFIDSARRLGAATAHWYVENFRFGPTSPLAPQLPQVAPHYDHLFLIQRGEAFEAARQMGARAWSYVPTGCNPGPAEQPDPRYAADIAFVGFPYPNRVELFRHLADLKPALWGPGWPKTPGLAALAHGQGRWVPPQEEAQIIAGAKVGLNIHSTLAEDVVIAPGDFLNPRVFTIPACGAAQLTDQPGPLAEVFEPGREVAVYADEIELRSELLRLLEHEDQRRELARRGRERALAEHTYAHRFQTMLRDMNLA